MKRLFIVRPEPGCAVTVAAARALGLAAVAAPLFAIHPCTWSPPAEHFDAIIAGSANAFRHGGPGLDSLRDLPVLAVGRATAEAARKASFTVAATGAGGLQTLIDQHARSFPNLLRLAGQDRITLDPPTGLRVTDCVVYASKPLQINDEVATALQQGGVVALHSALAASHFAAECDRLGIDQGRIKLAVIGPRVAEACGSGWAEVANAETPSDAALLALARVLCQK